MELIPIEYRPIIIDFGAYKALLSIESKTRADAMALYLFYYGIAVWRKTKCTEPHTMKGLGISKMRLRRARKALLSVRLIDDIGHIRYDKY